MSSMLVARELLPRAGSKRSYPGETAVTARSVALPVTSQTIVFASSKIQLYSVEKHSQSQIEPAPNVSPSFSSLARPPLSIAAVTTCRVEVLHQKTCVDGDQDRRTEPTG